MPETYVWCICSSCKAWGPQGKSVTIKTRKAHLDCDNKQHSTPAETTEAHYNKRQGVFSSEPTVRKRTKVADLQPVDLQPGTRDDGNEPDMDAGLADDTREENNGGDEDENNGLADPGSLEDDDDRPDPPEMQQQPAPAVEEEPEGHIGLQQSNIRVIQISLDFIKALKDATLDNLGLKMAYQVKNPIQETLTIDDPDHRLSLDIYLAITNASEAAYNLVSAAVRRRYPDSDILSCYRVKKLVEDLSGVSAISDDMCVNSCIAFTGPWKDSVVCPECSQPRYEEGKPGIPRKRFQTIPIGPQIQAKYQSKESAESMDYRKRCTEKNLAELRENNGARISPFCDLFDGTDYIFAVADGRILDDDIVFIMSLDGAQLYRMKKSDTWIYIWIVMNQSPNLWYQKRNVFVGAVIPGLNKPKNLDSFLFRGLEHFSVLQKEGLVIWNAGYASKHPDAPASDALFTVYPFLALISADEPGMAAAAGMTGHFGKHGCRFMCPLKSRRPPDGTHYYPARFKPLNYEVPGCDHPDVDLRGLLAGFNSTDSRARYLRNLSYVVAS